ncbi:hypothetical protein Tco_0443175 [Tanacetum coccineum]
MYTRASNSELVKKLSEPERTMNRRLRRRNRRFHFERRNERPAQPRIVYLPILDINYFCHFLDILENYNPVDDEPMWAADRVVAPTSGNQFDGRIKIDPRKHIHEFLGICDLFKYRDTKNEVVRLMIFPLSLMGEAKTSLFDRLLEEIRTFSQHENETLTDAWLRMKEMLRNDKDDKPMSPKAEAKFMQTF